MLLFSSSYSRGCSPDRSLSTAGYILLDCMSFYVTSLLTYSHLGIRKILNTRLWNEYIPSSKMMHANIAIRAPILSPMGSTYASTLQDWTIPSLLQPQTRIVRVLVLLMGGFPLSLMTIGSRYTSCFCRLNPLCFANMLRVLSEKGKICIVSPHRVTAKTTAFFLMCSENLYTNTYVLYYTHYTSCMGHGNSSPFCLAARAPHKWVRHTHFLVSRGMIIMATPHFLLCTHPYRCLPIMIHHCLSHTVIKIQPVQQREKWNVKETQTWQSTFIN